MTHQVKPIAFIGFAVFLTITSGCSRIVTDYGASSGRTGKQSLNGFGALRATFQQAGFNTRDVRRLTDRVAKCDAIVWTPSQAGSIPPRITRWFERWLQTNNRTLVFVIPDSGSEADYWIEASQFAEPKQRLEYRRLAAKSVNQRIQWRLNRKPMSSNGWFTFAPKEDRQPIEVLEGPWAGAFAAPTRSEVPFELEFKLEGFAKKKENKNAKKNSGKQKPAKPQNNTTAGPTGPGSMQITYSPTTTTTDVDVAFSALLKDARGELIVGKVASKTWRESKIFVVNGGSLLTNYAFTKDFAIALADQVVVQSKPTAVSSPKVGFISVDPWSLSVSETKPGVPKASGMELLTVWPLSLVTIHATLLLIVACLMLLPSLGRPRRVRYHAKSKFGDHLDAVAALMNRAHGQHYARQRISDYMRRIHGETSGPWIIEEPKLESITSIETSNPETSETTKTEGSPFE